MQDVLTFDKMVNAFPVSLVKFDVAYPYGDKHDEFAKISEEAAELPNMFIGEVGIKDYGDKVICYFSVMLRGTVVSQSFTEPAKHFLILMSY